MIKVNIKKNNEVIEEISIKGHAMFDDYGKDIVCAGVSSSLITTVNAIISFDKDSINYNTKPYFILSNNKNDNITNTLLDNFVSILYEMENNYRNNIKVKEESNE